MSEEERIVPSSDLDFQSMITNPVWGKNSAIGNLKNNLGKIVIRREYKKGDVRLNPDTQQLERVNEDITIDEEFSEWNKSQYHTQDFRLSNLDKNQVDWCIENQDLAFALLQFGCPKSFMVCTDENANVLEFNHSKGGWFRQGLNTMRTETRQEVRNIDEKGNFFGIKK